MATPRDLRGPLASVAATGVALSAAMLVLGSARAGWSTSVGAFVAVANLWVIGQNVGSTLGKHGGAAAGAWRALGVLKMLILYGGVWLLLTRHVVDPIPFVVGLGALPIGLVTGSLLFPGRAKEAPPSGSSPEQDAPAPSDPKPDD